MNSSKKTAFSEEGGAKSGAVGARKETGSASDGKAESAAGGGLEADVQGEPGTDPAKASDAAPGGAENREHGSADQELARIVEAWPTLPEATRRAMLSLMGVAEPTTTESQSGKEYDRD